MATYTTYYNLDKYEGTDRPNLRDQYNAAMDKIDNQLHTQAGEQASQSTTIAALQQTQTSQGSTIVQLQSDMSTAQSNIAAATAAAAQAQADATAAGTTASSAAIDAAKALAELEGLTIHHISKEDEGLEWSVATGANIDTSQPYTVDGIIVEESNGKAFACLHFRFFPRTDIPTSTTVFNMSSCFLLQQWEFGEAGRCYGWGGPYNQVMSEVAGTAGQGAYLGWTLSSTLPALIPTSVALSGMIMCRLTAPSV